MKEITAYQTTDGRIFTDERSAKSHQQDLIGAALDNLVGNDNRGNITRVDRQSMLINTMKDPFFEGKVKALYNSLFFDEDE